jgi:hypothetical protein
VDRDAASSFGDLMTSQSGHVAASGNENLPRKKKPSKLSNSPYKNALSSKGRRKSAAETELKKLMSEQHVEEEALRELQQLEARLQKFSTNLVGIGDSLPDWEQVQASIAGWREVQQQKMDKRAPHLAKLLKSDRNAQESEKRSMKLARLRLRGPGIAYQKANREASEFARAQTLAIRDDLAARRINFMNGERDGTHWLVPRLPTKRSQVRPAQPALENSWRMSALISAGKRRSLSGGSTRTRSGPEDSGKARGISKDAVLKISYDGRGAGDDETSSSVKSRGASSLHGSTRRKSPYRPMCEECEDAYACLSCEECGVSQCSPCSRSIHAKGMRKLHQVVPLVRTTSRPPSATDKSRSPSGTRCRPPPASPKFRPPSATSTSPMRNSRPTSANIPSPTSKLRPNSAARLHVRVARSSDGSKFDEPANSLEQRATSVLVSHDPSPEKGSLQQVHSFNSSTRLVNCSDDTTQFKLQSK